MMKHPKKKEKAYIDILFPISLVVVCFACVSVVPRCVPQPRAQK